MRRGWFWAGLAVSVGITALMWAIDLPGFFLFLLLPFLFSWPRRQDRRCPACGWSTTDPDARFCPRDKTPLEGPSPRPFQD